MLPPAFLELHFIASILILSKKPQYSIFQIITLFPSLFSKTTKGLLHFLQLESLKTTKWFKENKMKINADKFQVLLPDKRKQDHKMR